MRQCQFYAVKELLQYGVPVPEITNVTGVAGVTVEAISKGAKLPDIIVLQADDRIVKCKKCRDSVLMPCFRCIQDSNPGKSIYCLRRPDKHNFLMLPVSLVRENH